MTFAEIVVPRRCAATGVVKKRAWKFAAWRESLKRRKEK
jgi:hypothetical protein